MLKDITAIEKQNKLRESFAELDRDKIHLLYYCYDFSWKNFFHNPLFLTTKILGFITGKPAIEHVAHISRFVYDEEKKEFEVKTFEASFELGMHESNLRDKILAFDGTVYIETLGTVDKKIAKEFEIEYFGVKYSRRLAAMSALGKSVVNKFLKPRRNGGFCSWLECIFLQKQGYLSGCDAFLMTPSDLFCKNLGEKKIIYKA